MPSKRRGVSELPYLCHSFGINNAIISPGSRNAPLIIAFASHPHIKCISITDERSAGYYALGMAQQLKKPVVLVCTSGTAMINYAPALAEAHYLGIPLVAVTADRPREWIDQNDGQTIKQTELYANMVKASYETPVETEKEEDLWYFRRIVSEALDKSTADIPGPVHINVPLREPLYEPLPPVPDSLTVIQSVKGKATLNPVEFASLEQRWKSFEKKLIICGMATEDASLSKVLSLIASNHEAVIVSENLANTTAAQVIDTPDTFMAHLNEQQKATFQPGLLITTGGPVVSKKLKKYLRSFRPHEHWHIGEHEPFTDTFQSLTHTIRISPACFFDEIQGIGPTNNVYYHFAKEIQQTIATRHNHFLQDIPFCDLAAYAIIFKHLPENSNIHLGNSTPVRYSQLFANKPGLKYFSNRGTSGIDGCLSTAAGAAMATAQPNIAIVGDLAFIYDSNALWNNLLPGNLRIIVIDNKGGNIFKLIDTTPVINPMRHYFETPHQVNIEKLCQAFGVDYWSAADAGELTDIIHEFFKPNGRPGVLHVVTSGDTSAGIFKQYYQYISTQQ